MNRFLKWYDDKFAREHFYKVNDNGTVHVNTTDDLINTNAKIEEPGRVYETITEEEFNRAKSHVLLKINSI